jgi:hypothetical protein
MGKNKKLADDELDFILAQTHFKDSTKQEKWNDVSNQTWFRQYAKKSKDNLRRIRAKVKKGIIHDKFNTSPKLGEEPNRGFEMPKQKKSKGKVKPVVHKNPKTTLLKAERKYTPETKKRVESASKKYPNASNYELRHGVNSKASQSYRVRHGFSKEYK